MTRFTLIAAAVSTVLAGAAPAFAQPVASIQHVSVHYQPKSNEYCLDTAAMDAGPMGAARLPVFECKSQDAWAQDGLTITRK
jgi:hypothetical protein